MFAPRSGADQPTVLENRGSVLTYGFVRVGE